MEGKRPNRHSNPSKFSLKQKKGRRRFLRTKKRQTSELLKAMC